MITINFHPDRATADGLPMLAALARDGRYRTQFETGTSAGGLTAHPGGNRWLWESRLFAGRYDDAPGESRPVYGACNDRSDPYGGSPRFGSAHLVLADRVSARATFCYPDSAGDPERAYGPEELPQLRRAREAAAADYLDDYIEAQVHGGVRLDVDVEAVVLDPSFAAGPIEQAARLLGVAVRFHPGFGAFTADLPDDYRGPTASAAARSLGEWLDPAVLGAATGVLDSQHLKWVWHLLARFGRRETAAQRRPS